MQVIFTTKTSQDNSLRLKWQIRTARAFLGLHLHRFSVPESDDLQIKSFLKVNFIEKATGTNQTDAVSGLNETDVTADVI